MSKSNNLLLSSVLLRELGRHWVGHQRWRRMLLGGLGLGEGELGVTRSVLCLGLEGALAYEGSCLVVGEWLSVAIVAASSEAIGATAAPVASVLSICAKGFIWSVIKPSTIIPIPKTAKIPPSRRVTIPTVISVITTSAAPWTTCKSWGEGGLSQRVQQHDWNVQ